jgi:hypothetical protein
VEDYLRTVITVLNGLLVTANVADDLGKAYVVDTAITLTDLVFDKINQMEEIPSCRR